MKKVFLFSLILYSLTSYAQREDYIGDYSYEKIGQKYNLTLDKDGTFSFNSYWNLSHGPDTSGSDHGKGTWDLKNDTIHFSANESDIGSGNRLNFNNTIAIVRNKPELIIVETEIFWLENLKMEKRM